MKEDKTLDLIRYKLERANETILEAKVMAENGFWNAVANRLYYACFYALTAVLLKNGEKPLTHAGVKSMFNQKFVKTGEVSLKLGKFYSEIFNKRQDGDYKDLAVFKKEDIEPFISEAETFIKTIENLISEK